MTYARTTKDTRSVIAAVEAVRFMAGDEQFDSLLEMLVSSTDRGVRAATEETVAEIIKKSKNRTDLANKIAPIFENSVNVEIRLALLRLLGRCGTAKALELVKNSLSSPDPVNQIAAATALSAWADDSAFPLLVEFIAGCTNETVRSKAFDAAIRFVSQPVITNDSATSKKLWTELNGTAKTRGERQAMIYGLVNFDDDWVIKLLEDYKTSDDSQISELASKALDRVKDRKKIKGTDK
jgi:HEAT repeat protein